MLWHIANSQLAVLGSIHFLDDPPSLSDAAKNAYAGATRIIFEANLSGEPDMSKGRYSSGESLSATIPKPLFDDVRRLWFDVGGTEDDLNGTKPWWAALRLIISLLKAGGFYHENGVDKHLWKGARDDGLEIQTLESSEQQIDVFATAPKDEQERFLALIAQRTAKVATEFGTMVECWRQRRPELLLPILADRLKLLPLMFGKMVIERNRNWMPRLLACHGDATPTLAVVGMLHLVGEHGLPALFQKQGIGMSQVDHPG